MSLNTEGYRQGLLPLRPIAGGMVYALSKKDTATSGTVVIGTLFLISKPFCVLVDSIATHSLASTRYTMQLNLENQEKGSFPRFI